MQNYFRLFAALGALAVALGAFGAHGLRNLVGPAEIETFTTGVRYQFYHAFAIGLVAVCALSNRFSSKQLNRAVWCFALGTLLFSGSLYALSLRGVHGLPVAFLGPITPVGGLLFIAGWVFLFLAPTSSARV